jgi:hypothetical protein
MRKRSLIAALAAATLTVPTFLGASSAGAGPIPACAGSVETAPDGKINVDGGPYVGQNDYPFAERLPDIVGPGSATFLLKWKNRTEATRKIRVLDDTNFGVSANSARRVFVGGVNRSRELRQQGRLVFSGVAPGKSVTLQVVLTNKGAGQNFTGYRLSGHFGGSSDCDQLLAVIND